MIENTEKRALKLIWHHARMYCISSSVKFNAITMFYRKERRFHVMQKFVFWCQILKVLNKSNTTSFHPLSANLTKWPNTLKQFVSKFPTNCLSVFGHFVNLALKGLMTCLVIFHLKLPPMGEKLLKSQSCEF